MRKVLDCSSKFMRMSFRNIRNLTNFKYNRLQLNLNNYNSNFKKVITNNPPLSKS